MSRVFSPVSHVFSPVSRMFSPAGGGFGGQEEGRDRAGEGVPA